MKAMTTFRIQWTACGKSDIAEFPAASMADARLAFDAFKVPGVRITRIEKIDPDESSPLRRNPPSSSPFGPSSAHQEIARKRN
jgi:hypothetical protein